MASSSSSPCAACKFLRRKCTQECVFAPYFPPDQPQKFACVHRVFGASNVAKILSDISTAQREEAVNSLAYEAQARLQDPIYGCVGGIMYLQNELKQIQMELFNAKKELSTYMAQSPPGTTIPMGHPHSFLGQSQNPNSMMGLFGVSPLGLGLQTHQPQQLIIQEPPQPLLQLQEDNQEQHNQQQLQMIEAHHLANIVAAREQDLMRNYEQQGQEQLVRFNSGFDPITGGGADAGPSSGIRQFNLINEDGASTYEQYEAQQEQQQQQHMLMHHHQHHQHHFRHHQPTQPPSHIPHAQLLLQSQEPPQQQQQHHRVGSDEGTSGGPFL